MDALFGPTQIDTHFAGDKIETHFAGDKIETHFAGVKIETHFAGDKRKKKRVCVVIHHTVPLFVFIFIELL